MVRPQPQASFYERPLIRSFCADEVLLAPVMVAGHGGLQVGPSPQQVSAHTQPVGPLLALTGVNPAVVAGVVDSHANESGAH